MNRYRHEALVYEGDAEFAARMGAFIEDGVSAGDAVMVVVPGPKIDLLRSRLGTDANQVTFADMAEVGRNPAWIIPAWNDFIAFNPDRTLRGVGQPVYPERSTAELLECQVHESLLNLAFADMDTFWLLCPYDRADLNAAVIAEARSGHPWVTGLDEADVVGALHEHLGEELFRSTLPEPAQRAEVTGFDAGSLGVVRDLVSRSAAAAGLGPRKIADLVLAVNEVATNSVRHGGGQGLLRTWRDGTDLVCEVRDRGYIADPLVDRTRPGRDPEAGRGLWLANQVCDLVQLRSTQDGVAARLWMHTAA